MTGLITNESAIVALQTLRSVTDQRDEVSQRIATGLEVRRSSDSPAFFLVSNQVRGDQAVINGIRDNLQLSIQALATAQEGLNQVGASLDIITDLVTTADSDIAIDELQFAVENEIAFIRSVLETTSFNGVNLLAGGQNVAVTTSVRREGGAFSLGVETLQGFDLAEVSLFGEGSIFDGTDLEVAGTTARAEAVSYFQSLIRAYDPVLALGAWDFNGDGTITFPDFDGVTELGEDFEDVGLNYFSFSPENITEDEAVYLASIGFILVPPDSIFASGLSGPGFVEGAGLTNPRETQNLGNFALTLGALDAEFLSLNDRDGDGVVLAFFSDAFDDLILGDGLVSFYGTQAIFDAFKNNVAPGSLVTFDEVTNIITFDQNANVQYAPPDLFGGTIPLGAPNLVIDPNFMPNRMLDDAFIREAADASGFIAVLEQFDLSDPFFDAQDALVLLDSLRTRLNLAQNELGVLERTLTSRQTSLSNLSDSLDIGVSALIEADLDEESARIQALLVQQQLAVDALAIASVQPQLILTLF